MTDRTEKFTDKTLLCIECNRPFIFTAGEQGFYYSKGLALPKRCPQCRLARKLSLQKGVEHG